MPIAHQAVLLFACYRLFSRYASNKFKYLILICTRMIRAGNGAPRRGRSDTLVVSRPPTDLRNPG